MFMKSSFDFWLRHEYINTWYSCLPITILLSCRRWNTECRSKNGSRVFVNRTISKIVIYISIKKYCCDHNYHSMCLNWCDLFSFWCVHWLSGAIESPVLYVTSLKSLQLCIETLLFLNAIVMITFIMSMLLEYSCWQDSTWDEKTNFLRLDIY